MTNKELIALAFAHVYTDEEKFVEAQAMEHTIANAGLSIRDHLSYGTTWFETHPDEVIEVIPSAFNQMREDFGGEGVDIEPEMRDWKKQAKKDTKLILKAGLPMTMANARLAFEKKGPFVVKK